jgi:Sulfotransferase domain
MVSLSGIDVLCAGMYRACSTWQYEVAAHLVEEHRSGRRLGYLASGEYTALLRGDTGKGTAWRVIKAHEGEPSMARELSAGRARALYVHRDVRDVVFSLMHKRGKTFEQILRQGMIHQILANDRFWMAQPDVLVQRYDDLISEPARGVTELADHLGLDLQDGESERIADFYSQESNRARTEAFRQRLEQAGVDLQNAGNTQICDPSSLLHWNHMRQKGAGSWQTTSTPQQVAILRRLCGGWLKARGYSLARMPGSRWDFTLNAMRDAFRGEIDIMVGRLNYLLRSTSVRFPKTASTFKRILGMPVDSSTGATVWADPIPARSASDSPSEAA